MQFWRSAALACVLAVLHAVPLMGETLQLKSGKEVEVIDGKIPERAAEQLYREAGELLKNGRLDLANEYWQLISERATGIVAHRADREREKIARLEYGSLVLLRNDQILTGRVTADLRTDLLGLEGREEIPIWQVEEIVAEYHPGYSQVSKTFYLFTILEIKFRTGEMRTSRIAGEIEFRIEAADGSVTEALLGKRYELLRPQDLGKQIEDLTAHRIVKLVIYPDLRRLE